MKKCILTTCLLMFSLTATAATYTFFQQPSPKAKTAFSTNSLDDIVPIFFSNDAWIKVGNRKDGRTGWIQKSAIHDLTISHTQYQQKFQHHQHGKHNKSDETFEYIGPKIMTQAQADKMIQRMVKRQKHIHQHMQAMMQTMNALFTDSDMGSMDLLSSRKN